MTRTTTRLVLPSTLVALALAASCAESPNKAEPPDQPGPTASESIPADPTTSSASASFALSAQTLVTDLEVPWSAAFLPDGDALVTERESARILRVSPDGQVDEVQTIDEVVPSGEGGLLGIAVSPTFADDETVYAYYTAADDNRIARFRLGATPEPIATGIPKAPIHNGGRIAFGPDGMLYAGTGDPDRTNAQNPDSLAGKILRMTPDGDVPDDNPFPGSLVYTLGHRNVQGLGWDSAGRMWESELGQNTFDEVNLIEAGKNYGWPEVEGPGDGGGRFVPPLVTWSTDEASPSGLAVRDDALYVAALRGQRLWRVPLDGTGGVGEPEAMFVNEFGRLRLAVNAPDGSLWLLTSNLDGRGNPVPDDDRIIKVTGLGGD